MSNLIKHVALVSESKHVSAGDASKIAAALRKQVARDFAPIWNVAATVGAFEKLDDVPAGTWTIIIKDDINTEGAQGIHMDRNGQPYSLVQASEETPQTCSHELIEMLVDPFGSRFVTSESIKHGQGRVNYLVEICDPSEAEEFGYRVNGFLLSDFYTPHFFDPVFSPSVRYSFTGAVTKPREILRGGYISWMDPATGLWWQANHFGAKIEFSGPHHWTLEHGKSWREIVDQHTPQSSIRRQRRKLGVTATATQLCQSSAVSASKGQAEQLRKDINNLLGK